MTAYLTEIKRYPWIIYITRLPTAIKDLVIWYLLSARLMGHSVASSRLFQATSASLHPVSNRPVILGQIRRTSALPQAGLMDFARRSTSALETR